jgi:hypothetical protein
VKNSCLLLVFVVTLYPHGVLHADGGAVRLSEKRGNHRITVFTSPTPLRAGPVDVSVFVQDAVTGEPIPAARITVQATPREHPEDAIHQRATAAAATNKLYQAADCDLAEAGWWDVKIVIQGLGEPIEVQFEMELDEPLPRIWEITPWIAWPVGVILLFFAHQWLVQRKRHGSQRIKKVGSPKENRPSLRVAQSRNTS